MASASLGSPVHNTGSFDPNGESAPARRRFEPTTATTAYQVGGHSVAHRMTDHLAGVEILAPGQIQPPFWGGYIGDVGAQGLIRSRPANVWANRLSATSSG